MASEVLLRRPLPKDDKKVAFQVKPPTRKVVKVEENEHCHCEECNKDEDLSLTTLPLQYEESGEEYLYYINRGPSLFPFRSPKKGTKTTKRVITFDNFGRNSSVFSEPQTYCNRYHVDPSVDYVIKESLNFYNNNTTNFRGLFNKTPDHTIHYQNLHEINSLLPAIVPRKPQKQLLLEQQFIDNYIYRMNSEINQIEADCLTNDHVSCVVNNGSIEEKKHVSYKVTEKNQNEEELPEVFSFQISKSMVKMTDEQLWSLARLHEENSEKNVDKSDNIINHVDVVIDEDATELNLKGFFLNTHPVIPLSCIDKLTLVNLSFNNFTSIPEQIFSLKNIASLNMRNNPLSIIPEGIAKMKTLRYLNFSFCNLTKVGESLFPLIDLEILDLSYNLIESIHNGIQKLVSLKELNLDGNRIQVLPRSILNLNLISLSINSNFTHKLFWLESCPPIPQRLVDLAMIVLMKNQLVHTVPNHLNANITGSRCDNCGGPMAGQGISVLKPVHEIFNAKDLPVLFYVCSQTCRAELQHTTERPFAVEE